MEHLKQFVPSQVCRQCDGCCRFKDDQSIWRPKVTPGEIDQLSRSIGKDKLSSDYEKIASSNSSERFSRLKLADIILNKETFKEGYIKATPCAQGHVCSFFNVQDNTCRVYSDRPFECQLYPFLIGKSLQGTGVYVHLMCPHIQATRAGEEFRTYVEYLKNFFTQKEVLNFLHKNPSLIIDYSEFSEELEYLFDPLGNYIIS